MAKVRTCPKWLISGIHEAGYYVYTYDAGTTTLKDTYTDNTQSAANTNPIILDARGEADVWWSGTYKVAVYTGDKDVDGVLVWSVDNYGEGENQISTGDFNSVKNGSFETENTTSGEPDSWSIVDYSTGAHELDTSDQYHGLNSLKFTSVGAGGGYATSEYFEVREGQETWIDWVMQSSVADVRNVVDIIWYTSAKTVISTTNIYNKSSANPTSWTAQSGSGVSPSTARYAQVRVYGCHSSDITPGSTWFDDITSVNGLFRLDDNGRVPFENKSAFRGAMVYRAVPLSVVTGTVTKMIFDLTEYDTDNIFNSLISTTQLNVPSGVTRIRLHAKASFSAHATGYRQLSIVESTGSSFVGKTELRQLPVNGTVSTEMSLMTPIIDVADTQEFEMEVFHDAGTNLSVGNNSTTFSMEIIE